MSEIDAYFTQSIVGAPFSALLGQRVSTCRSGPAGIEVPLDGATARLSAFWHDEALLGASAAGPLLRRIPSPARRWLERHALVIALAGLTSVAVCVGWVAWSQLR